jgi:hypothetical protein
MNNKFMFAYLITIYYKYLFINLFAFVNKNNIFNIKNII